MRLAERVRTLPPYLFAELDRKVAARRAQGADVISLGVGDPDLPTPPHVVEALQRACEDPATHRYPSYYGMPELREAIASFYERRFGVLLDPDRYRLVALPIDVGEDSRRRRQRDFVLTRSTAVENANAKTFLDAGIHVICDKPLTTTLEAALDLAKIVERTGLIFGLTHNYTGYPMVRQAREMVLAGELGAIRIIQVEYAQDWLSTPLEKTGQKQAEWRTDPARSGPGGSLGDIGTHAFNLACFVTGLSCQEIAAEVTTFVPGRRLDDNVQLLLRFSKGAKGTLWASQVAAGNENNLRLRVYGEKAGLEWQQENPNELVYAPLGQPRRVLRRGGPGAGAAAARAIRIPAGHPEGYLEAFAQLYKDLAEQITAKREGGSPDPQSLLVPGIADGVEGMRFISAVLESSRNRSAWTALSGSR